MKILNHPLCTTTIGSPSDMPNASSALPVAYHTDEFGTWTTSFWKPSADDLVMLNADGGIMLHVRASGRQHPIVAMGIWPSISPVLQVADAPAAPIDQDAIMEAVQEYASAWSLVGGRFDNGSLLEQAEAMMVRIRSMLDFAPLVVPLPVDQGATTDLSKRLRDYANSGWKYTNNIVARADLLAACDEIDRYYGGMMAWKKTAEKKDRDLSEERINAVNERCATRSSAPLPLPAGPSEQPAAEATRSVCGEAARKLRTYAAIYTGDKQARRLADELENIAAPSAKPSENETRDDMCPSRVPS